MKKIIIYLIGLVCFIPMTAFGVSVTLENPSMVLSVVGGCAPMYLTLENPWLYWTNNATIAIATYKKVGNIDGCMSSNNTDPDLLNIMTAIPVCAENAMPAGVEFYNDVNGIYEMTDTCPMNIVPPGTNNGYYKLGAKCVAVGYGNNLYFSSCNGGTVNGDRDWVANCATTMMTSNAVKVMGVAACSSVKPSSMTPGGGVLADTALRLGTPYCYCKVISPYESKWVFGAEYLADNPADNNCNDSCAGFCAYAMNTNANFRKVISIEDNIVK